MNTRHKQNPNLTIFNQNNFNGIPVQTQHGDLIRNYLGSAEQTIRKSIEEHPRTLAIRVDLHMPDMTGFQSNVISKFTESLKAQIRADLLRKRQAGTRIHPCTLRYVWVKETSESSLCHYHVLLLVNHDTYNCLGDFSRDEGNMAARIKKAWASALGLNLFESEGLVHFARNGLYHLNRNHPSFGDVFFDLFQRVSYFAKVKTKHYNDGSNAFGCSRN